jgi:hypothetical protein
MVQVYRPQARHQDPIAAALLCLATACDGANQRDSIGFNATDTNFGHSLAQQVRDDRELTTNQRQAALAMLKKYRRQLEAADIFLPTIPELLGLVESETESDDEDYEDSEDSELDAVTRPSEFRLNQQQQAAIALMREFLGSDSTWFVLKGYAGTGKTTTIQTLVKEFQTQRKGYICMAAPTNKAVKVLKRMAAKEGLHNIDFATVYQLLGMKLEVDDDGKEKPVSDPNGNSSFDQYDLIICDEASMINSEILTCIQGETRKGFPKVIFMGDPAQLPPVGEKESAVFVIEPQTELTEVMRYGSVIGNLVTKIRTDLEAKTPPFMRSACSDEGEIKVSDKFDWLDDLIAAYKSEAYQLNPDHCKALAWTNKTVDWLNRYIRDNLYGLDAEQFMRDERLIAVKPLVQEREVVMQTSSECTVLGADRDQYVTGKEVWQCIRLRLLTEDDRRIRRSRLLHLNKNDCRSFCSLTRSRL